MRRNALWEDPHSSSGREHRAFQPFEIVHVIEKENSTQLINKAEFNPGVETAPCNRPLSLQFLRGIAMGNMCPHFYVVRGFSNMYIQSLSGHYLQVYNSTNIADNTMSMEGLFSSHTKP
jgi:hypothetical protein